MIELTGGYIRKKYMIRHGFAEHKKPVYRRDADY